MVVLVKKIDVLRGCWGLLTLFDKDCIYLARFFVEMATCMINSRQLVGGMDLTTHDSMTSVYTASIYNLLNLVKFMVQTNVDAHTLCFFKQS